MNARAIIYNLMIIGAMLLAGCSHDDVTIDITPSEPVAISFMPTLSPTLAEGEEMTRAGQPGVMNSEDLRTTGFGVFASLNENKTPDMMFNQEVKFTFVGDIDKPDPDPLKGYWSYQPLKYWPTGLTAASNFYISAYAPYQNLPIDPSGTGIIGISANNEAPYIDYRRCEKPDEMIDLLWYYDKPSSIPAATSDHAAGTQKIEMRHALARLEINVALATAPASGTKVLIEQITLKGKMAKTGRLSLSTQETAIETVIENEVERDVTRYYPVWSNQVNDKDGNGDDKNHTITIKNSEDDDSYGIIDSQVRYIDGLPYAWQPAGLTTTLQNALSTGDRKTYVYLIPQDELKLKLEVKYQKWTEGASAPESGVKSIDTSPVKTPITVGSPLKGNTRYILNITLSEILN